MKQCHISVSLFSGFLCSAPLALGFRYPAPLPPLLGPRVGVLLPYNSPTPLIGQNQDKHRYQMDKRGTRHKALLPDLIAY